jgi:glutaredoxin 3
MTSIRELVNQIIDQHRIAVFSETHCASCIALKKTLVGAGIQYYAEELDKWDPIDKHAALDYLEHITGERTVPRVFVDGRAVGGNREFQNEYVQGARLSELRGA